MSDVAAVQDARLRTLLAELDGRNAFYTAKLRQAGLRGDACDRATFVQRFPPTTKAELQEDQRRHPPYGSDLTYAVERYVRFSQTSGSTGEPLRWLDTAESWSWMLGCWTRILERIGVRPGDRLLAAFSFGPFLGFWTCFEAAARIGCLCIPAGGLTTRARIQLIADNAATVLCCTPTYALRLGEEARDAGLVELLRSVRLLVVAGEPGGSIPAVRARLADLWPRAAVSDHHGMTEIGPVSWQCPGEASLLHIPEEDYIAEILDPATFEPVASGATGELVLSNLGRTGSPLLRYRTGDLVRAAPPGACSRGIAGLALDGGILGRTDDMVVVRGINVWPAAIEAVVRRFAPVAEYAVDVRRERGMTELELLLEPADACRDASGLAVDVGEALRAALALRIPVRLAERGSLPRFELKARRWRVREGA